MTTTRGTTTEMATKNRRLRAWVAAVSVASVIGGTAYFARTAEGQVNTAVIAADGAAPASAPVASSGTGGSSAAATTTAQKAATPVPVKAKRSRGS